LIVVAGPTAVGKTDLVMALASWLDCEVISADSRQIYREMNIGTAKPQKQQLEKVKHHFINERSVTESFTAADFEEQSLARLAKIFQERRMAILSGGTGLYIEALCRGFDKIPDVELATRNHFEQIWEEEGLMAIQNLLKDRDPEYSDLVDLNNHRRIIRALGVIETTGEKYSSFLKGEKYPRPFKTINILLAKDREVLYQNIEDRVDNMIAHGLEAEVASLQEFKKLTAMQTVGYQEWIPYFEGTYDVQEVIRLIKRNSRRYAKRQMTWFRKYGNWQTFRPDQQDQIKTFIKEAVQ
jgi:tRNA dimethylallyltransferase